VKGFAIGQIREVKKMEMSNGNNVMRDLIRELIPEEDVQKAIRETVSEVVTSYTMKTVVREVLMEFVREKGETYLRETVEDIVSQPVRIDDGWGRVKEVGSFEDYVRQSLNTQCMNQWGIERKLREAVDGKLKKIAEDIVKKHINDDLQGEVIEELVKQCSK
jgi:hypothetical protein